RGDGWQPKYDGNGYYAGSIPTDKFTVGMTVQYYFYLEYANSSSFTTTSVGTPDLMGSIAYLGGTRRGAIRSSSRSGRRRCCRWRITCGTCRSSSLPGSRRG
ncbi:MAG: hypothetical protein IJG13_23925, partial [Kiritimatiellae bacterium]|nr:hypothetical protein [Kiritimatiellia bacterium]